ncbi:MAG: hypothetical protein ACREO4_13025 [Lysobacter sp.]
MAGKDNEQGPGKPGPVSRDITPPDVKRVRICLPTTPLTPDTDPPEPGIPFRTPPAKFRKVALSQRSYFNDLAERISAGDPSLTRFDGAMAAGAIRAFASQIPLEEPRARGQAPKLDPGSLALEFAVLVEGRKMSRNAARDQLAEKWGVSETSIKKALQKYGETALSWLKT